LKNKGFLQNPVSGRFTALLAFAAKVVLQMVLSQFNFEM
jgi:hypothetical protein